MADSFHNSTSVETTTQSGAELTETQLQILQELRELVALKDLSIVETTYPIMVFLVSLFGTVNGIDTKTGITEGEIERLKDSYYQNPHYTNATLLNLIVTYDSTRIEMLKRRKEKKENDRKSSKRMATT